MNKIITSLVVFFMISNDLCAQVLPKEGSKLNYRIIGFQVPKQPHVSTYKIEIARDDQKTEEGFNKNIIVTDSSQSNKLIAEVPAFGARYTWRMVYGTNGQKNTKSSFYHFSTQTCKEIDTNLHRVRITKSADAYKDAYVFLNANNTLYDMEGHPVWFLPQTDKLRFSETAVRDLKITSRGTITFVVSTANAYEVDYDGNILWEAPNTGVVSGDTSEHYNHEFTRLDNGHYMLSGSINYQPIPLPSKNGVPPPPPRPIRPGPGGHPMGGPRHINQKQTFGTLIEYDEKGKLVWSWRSDEYFQSSDIVYFPNSLRIPMNDVHQNSFSFDEKNKVIYVSYKNVNRILKIKYPEGTVLRSYGEKFYPGKNEAGTGLYCFQHAVKHSDDGYLYVFNNNSCHMNGTPQLLKMREPDTDTGNLTVTWQYDFPVSPLPPAFYDKIGGGGSETVGGNEAELPDHSMFVSLCKPYGNLYIISPDKKILWSAEIERWVPDDNKWMMEFQYRASIIPGRKELEKLIWNSATTKK